MGAPNPRLYKIKISWGKKFVHLQAKANKFVNKLPPQTKTQKIQVMLLIKILDEIVTDYHLHLPGLVTNMPTQHLKTSI